MQVCLVMVAGVDAGAAEVDAGDARDEVDDGHPD